MVTQKESEDPSALISRRVKKAIIKLVSGMASRMPDKLAPSTGEGDQHDREDRRDRERSASRCFPFGVRSA